MGRVWGMGYGGMVHLSLERLSVSGREIKKMIGSESDVL